MDPDISQLISGPFFPRDKHSFRNLYACHARQQTNAVQNILFRILNFMKKKAYLQMVIYMKSSYMFYFIDEIHFIFLIEKWRLKIPVWICTIYVRQTKTFLLLKY